MPFPGSLDSFTNPTATDNLNSVTVPHHTQHSQLNDAVEALEILVGVTGSLVVTTHEYKIRQLEIQIPNVSVTGTIRIIEVDGSPVDIVNTLKFPNGTIVILDDNIAQYLPLFKTNADVLFTTYTGLGGFGLQVNDAATGVEAVRPYDVVAYTGTTLIILEDAINNKVIFRSNPPAPVSYTFNHTATNNIAFSTGVTEWPNSQRRKQVDLTNALEARLQIRTVTAFPSGTVFAVQYSLDESNWHFLNGNVGPQVPMNTNNTTTTSAWTNITGSAKADVTLRMAAIGFSTGTNQTIGTIEVQFR